MACNGFDHPPDCVCNFRGGHGNSVPPRPAPRASLLGNLAPPRRRVFEGRSLSMCRKCGEPIYYVPGAHGGSFIAAGDGSYLRHKCRREVPKTRPRTRMPPGWVSASVRRCRAKSRDGGQVLRLIAPAEGAPFVAEMLGGIRVEAPTIVLMRRSPEDAGVVEMTYLDEQGSPSSARLLAKRH